MTLRRDLASLPKQIESDLAALIREMRPDERFPSETELAERFGVSRVTLRAALAALEAKGLIVRKHGLGTFVNRNVLQINTRIDESVEFSQLIEAAGYKATVQQAQAEIETVEGLIAERLNVAEGSPAAVFRKVFAADGVPVIYVINLVPLALMPEEARRPKALAAASRESIYDFLAATCGETVSHQIAVLRAVPASAQVARHLGGEAGLAVLNIEEVGYNGQDKPVFYSDEYYLTDRIEFQMLRKPAR